MEYTIRTFGTLILVLMCAFERGTGQVVNPANGHTYVRLAQPMTYFTARTQAAAMGGYLVAINDAAENAFIVQNFSPWSGNRYDWVGLTDEVAEGTFQWDSGEPLIYTNWMGGEPNNLGDEDHVEINLNPSGVPAANFGAWNDIHGTNLNNAIVEIPSPPLPPPCQIINPMNGHTYVRLAQPMTFFTARTQAAAMGGYLVAINDAAENAFIVQNFSPWAGNRYDWIGLTDENNEGTFLWDSGEPLTYMNWMGGEPNNLGDEDHVEINLNPAGVPAANFGAWNDNHGTNLNNAIVEIPSAQTLTLYGSAGAGAANLSLWATGVPCGGSLGATLVSLTPAFGGPGTGPVFGLNPDYLTWALLLVSQPALPPAVEPWRFDLGLPGASAAYPHLPWTAPWGSSAVFSPGVVADVVLVILTPTAIVASNVVRFTF